MGIKTEGRKITIENIKITLMNQFTQKIQKEMGLCNKHKTDKSEELSEKHRFRAELLNESLIFAIKELEKQ